MPYFKLDTMQSSPAEKFSLPKPPFAILTSVILIFLFSGFLFPFCWVMPASAATSLDFYRQPIDKLNYSREDYHKSIVRFDFSKPVTRLDNNPNNKFERQAVNRLEPNQGVSLEEVRDRIQLANIRSFESIASSTVIPSTVVTPSTITMAATVPITPPDELVQPAPIQEVLTKPNIAPQSSRRVPVIPRTNPRPDPHRLIEAKRRHSHPTTAARWRGTSPIAATLPEKVSQFNRQISLIIERQPGGFQTVLVNKRGELQRLASQKIERRHRSLDIIIEDVIKAPLRYTFKKIEALSHRAAEQLS